MFEVLVTEAVNCVDAPEATIAVAGVMVTTTAGALATVIAKGSPMARSEESLT
jgi:hypothetical protein